MILDIVIKMIERAYMLGMQVQTNEIDLGLAEEVTSECAEFLAVWQEDWSAFESLDMVDKAILQAVQALKLCTVAK
jgi:hypothetical protein